MVEQVQTTLNQDVLNSFGVAANDTKTATDHTHSLHVSNTTSAKDDTVTLSESAQANQLYLQGNSVTKIASLLGIPATAVERDLNIASNSVTSTGVQAATPATQTSDASSESSPAPYTTTATSTTTAAGVA